MSREAFCQLKNVNSKVDKFDNLDMQSWSLILYFSYTESNILPHPKDTYSISQSFRQHSFLKDEFHCLNMSRVGTFTVYDIFDCTFECLNNPSCLSVNMAAFKGAKGDIWCELLSSDKYRNSTEYKRNKSSHHFTIKVWGTLHKQ